MPAVLDEAALLACLSVLTTNATAPTTVPAPVSTPVHPPRLNCAGYCQLCGTLGCYRPECLDVWSQTTWIVCPACKGYGGDPATCTPCTCYLGVVQIDDMPEPVYYVTTPVTTSVTAPIQYDDAPEMW